MESESESAEFSKSQKPEPKKNINSEGQTLNININSKQPTSLPIYNPKLHYNHAPSTGKRKRPPEEHRGKKTEDSEYEGD